MIKHLLNHPEAIGQTFCVDGVEAEYLGEMAGFITFLDPNGGAIHLNAWDDQTTITAA
ncbi:hypothetical protein NIES4103_27960 [Nostoc sp. NIES-4103]|nr:hypothetical protein NIES4103_27960 [Nostoc sp. NIES-4103]